VVAEGDRSGPAMSKTMTPQEVKLWVHLRAALSDAV
jgi:hypothetical protein